MQIAYQENDQVANFLLWEKSLAKFETEIDPQIFAAYIKPLKFASMEGNTVEVIAPSTLVAKQVEQNFKTTLEETLSRVFNRSVTIHFSVFKDINSRSEQLSSQPVVKKRRAGVTTQSSKPAITEAPTLDTKYTFSNFVVGNSNQFCNAAALQASEKPGLSYNPLFIYGGVGLGKTHLMHAIGNAVHMRSPEKKILYISSEAFTNELIKSLRTGKMDDFKSRLRDVDVLLIDDIQFIAGKERTQEEFFHTFNALYAAKKQIVITSDRIPQDLPGIEERLRTRFSWGLTADLQVPDYETRIAILKRKSVAEGFNLPEDVAALISESISSNVRELEGALTRLQAFSSLTGKPVTVELAHNALQDILAPKRINIKIPDIKGAVATHFGLSIADLSSKRRTRNLSFPRHIAMYLCRKHTTASYPEIGAQFGGRDHSSVIHAASVVSEKIKKDIKIKLAVADIEKNLLG